MCKFTYLGYGSCDEPDKHYLIRREKCSAQAHLMNWCPPDDEKESRADDERGKFWVNLPCPICADTPVIYDQPLLTIAHSRRSALPAPQYNSVTGKYSRFGKHHAHYATSNKASQQNTPESLVPEPLKMARFQVERAASETSVARIKHQELSPDYQLPAATYNPPPPKKSVPKTVPPSLQPTPLITPPPSRESSRSPPQHRIDASARAIPPGESSRHELASLRGRAKAAAAATSKDSSRPSTPQSQRDVSDRSRSSSASSTAPPVLPPLPFPPSRKTSNASFHSSASSVVTTSSSSPPSKSSSVMSRAVNQRPRRKDSATRSPPQDSFAENLAAAAMRPFERGRRPTRSDTGGSASERSDSPIVWRPTISQPTLQQDSLGIGAGSVITLEPFKQRLIPFRPTKNGRSVARGEGLVESPPRPKTRADGDAPQVADTTTTAKTSTALSLFPNPELDDKVATEAFHKMFETEQKAHAYQAQAQAQAMAQARAQTDRAMGLVQPTGGAVVTSTAFAVAAPAKRNKEAGDVTTNTNNNNGQDVEEYSVQPASSKTAFVARRVDKMLPNMPIPTALRRIKTGQVKTVTVGGPGSGSNSTRRPMKRANTADPFLPATTTTNSTKPQISAPTNFVKVRAGAPLFSFAGVHNQKYTEEFEIVTGPDSSLMAEPALGEAF